MHGVPPPKERVPGCADGFYPLIQGVPPKQYAATFPLLIATIDRWGAPDDREPVTASFGMMFFGVKRFKGIMGVLMRLGVESRPVMLRLKQFLHSDEVAAARTKFLPGKNVGVKSKRFDPAVERLRKSVETWEKTFGTLAVAPISRVGKTYRPIVVSTSTPSESAEAARGGGTKRSPARAAKSQTRPLALTGNVLVSESVHKRRNKTTTLTKYPSESETRSARGFVLAFIGSRRSNHLPKVSAVALLV